MANKKIEWQAIDDPDYSSGMEFDVCKPIDKPFNQAFPNIRRIPALYNYKGGGIHGRASRPDPDKVKRYFVLLGSKDNPVHRAKNLSYKDKQRLCFMQAGFEYSPKTGKFRLEGYCQQIMSMEDERLYMMLVDILKYQQDLMFSQLMVSYHRYYENISRLYNRVEDDKDKDQINSLKVKSELLRHNEEMIESIRRMEDLVFGEHAGALKEKKVIYNLMDVYDPYAKNKEKIYEDDTEEEDDIDNDDIADDDIDDVPQD